MAENPYKKQENVASGAIIGRYDHALDPKKRLTIPSEWRDLFVSGVYVIPNRNEKGVNCLDLMPKAEMDVLLEKLREKSLFDPKASAYSSAIGRNSQQLQMDGQGRIRIADKFLSHAGLSSMVAMIGSFRKLQLLDPSKVAPAEVVDVDGVIGALSALGI